MLGFAQAKLGEGKPIAAGVHDIKVKVEPRDEDVAESPQEGDRNPGGLESRTEVVLLVAGIASPEAGRLVVIERQGHQRRQRWRAPNANGEMHLLKNPPAKPGAFSVCRACSTAWR